ncbi:hypothetical protein L208DRAFT_1368534 [Tricholoma matsutake]|nr:hypothetical protein L208DRAFT_1368534 [Tricholoma matsutake 945]
MSDQSEIFFKRLKPVCVPLLGASLLSPTSTSNVSKLLADLIQILRDAKAAGFALTPSLISYAFFPLSTILRRNSASDIPDQILEKLFIILGLLCDDWWWDFELATWEQIFKLCGAVIGGIEGKGKGKERDDETKQAAAQCLHALLRQRTSEEDLSRGAPNRLATFQTYSQTNKFVPILGQTLDSLLMTAQSRSLSLQRVSLELLSVFIIIYAADDLIPSILPGVVSCMTKVSLGISGTKGWANGEIVARALQVMQIVVVRAIGDDICIKEGALRQVVNLEDLAQQATEPHIDSEIRETRPYSTLRTASWLRGTSSQLLIALNTLTPLVSHPTPSALHSLSIFSSAILRSAPLSLPHVQPLLLSFLLSLSNSSFPSVAKEAHMSLSALLTSSAARHSLMQTLMHSMNENLVALPRLIPTHADAKVEHAAGQVEAICRLAITNEQADIALSSVSSGISKLLGPTGGIEKWGWSLLSVLEFVEPRATVSQTSSAQLMLENDPDAPQWVSFPAVTLVNVFSRCTQDALERMFRSLGRATGDGCLFSAEWFADVGRSGTGSRSVAATWCSCRLLEGVAEISLTEGLTGDALTRRRSKRLTKLARALAKGIAELWDETSSQEKLSPNPDDKSTDDESGANLLVQHVQGVSPIHETLRIVRASPVKEHTPSNQPILHKALQLQILAVSAGILQARFASLFIYTLYPVLHSLVSPVAYLSSTALATLNYITVVTSYASPANLLLANFDYALDAVSRRLSRRWLDVDASKVLALMIRLVGRDVVDRAGDVVEECFDRLDEFHGYEVIVEGLVAVLGEVIHIIAEDAGSDGPGPSESPSPAAQAPTPQSLDEFFSWLSSRNDFSTGEHDTTDYGPAPREAWGEPRAKSPSTQVDNEETSLAEEPGPNADPPLTPIQALTKQIISRSLYFLTHGSPVIRSTILSLLTSSIPVLRESALLPSIHSAWPFILNRLSDKEPFVVSAAAALVEALVTHVGSFMFRRIWDDIWPRFRVLLGNLEAADSTSALSRRGYGAVGSESAYTHSHRLYRCLIKTMTAAMKGVHPHDASVWEVILAFRRFLHDKAHEELQLCARELYVSIGRNSADAVWLSLTSTSDDQYPIMTFMRASQWNISTNVAIIFQTLGV